MENVAQSRDPDFIDIKLNKDGKLLPAKWGWDSSSVESMKKILIAMTPMSYSSKDRDQIRVMDEASVLVSFIRKFPELSRPFYPSDLRSVERALQLNWQTFEQQFISILGKIESERLLNEINEEDSEEDDDDAEVKPLQDQSAAQVPQESVPMPPLPEPDVAAPQEQNNIGPVV